MHLRINRQFIYASTVETNLMARDASQLQRKSNIPMSSSEIEVKVTKCVDQIIYSCKFIKNTLWIMPTTIQQ